MEGYAAGEVYRGRKLKKRLFKILKVVSILMIFIAIGGYIFMQQPQFGKNPTGERLERIKNSPNYKNGKFQNLTSAPQPKIDSSFSEKLNDLLLNKSERLKPSSALPSIKTDLKSLKPEEDVFIWFGHSSYFLQVDGKKILIDPVLSENASPVKFYNKSYQGSSIYTIDDIPDIDYLLISHDHYDHLDYDTITKLKPKVEKVITGLGVGAHFEHWGYDKKSIIEMDWNETVVLVEGFEVTVTSAKHRSGRGLKSNQTLWASFVIKTSNMKIFYSGDSGYGTHFSDIGNTYGPFDLAIMECGQYSKYWPNSHMIPEQVVQASLDLKAEKLMPGHWSKFSLSIHDWDEPIIKVIEESKRKKLPVLYPMIGEKVDVRETISTEAWWEKVQ
jgi:L-ascorbate metabolism protein UlaG (beta-lactamase superfamily)